MTVPIKLTNRMGIEITQKIPMDDGMNPTSSGLRMEQQNIITLLF